MATKTLTVHSSEVYGLPQEDHREISIRAHFVLSNSRNRSESLDTAGQKP
jgi:hypothetical protein